MAGKKHQPAHASVFRNGTSLVPFLSVLLTLARAGRLRHLGRIADVNNGRALCNQLISGPLLGRSGRLELANGLRCYMASACDDGVAVQAWQDEGSHSP